MARPAKPLSSGLPRLDRDLLAHCEAVGLSGAEIARLTGRPASQVSNWRRGDKAVPGDALRALYEQLRLGLAERPR